MPRLNSKCFLRELLFCAVVCSVAAGFEPNAAAQAAKPASTQRAGKAAHPSNAQLADPKIEARVDRLLRQMTLEEKIGQLVQYNDTGDASACACCRRQAGRDCGGEPWDR